MTVSETIMIVYFAGLVCVRERVYVYVVLFNLQNRDMNILNVVFKKTEVRKACVCVIILRLCI